ncbi:uncharacterized protein LOC144154270 [Haemaphysalis longicornis]
MENIKPKSNRMCCVPQCTNRSVPGKTSVHTFPRDKKARKVWTTKLRIGKAVTNTMVVGSSHFTKTDFFWSHIHGLQPLKPRLKKGAVPSRNILVRSHEKTVKPRSSRRATLKETEEVLEGSLAPGTSPAGEGCICAPSTSAGATGNEDIPLQEWLQNTSACPGAQTVGTDPNADAAAAEALLLLRGSSEPETAEKAVQANTVHDCLQKFRISELLVSDNYINTFTGVPSAKILNKVVALVKSQESENRMEATVQDRVVLVLIVLKQAMSFSSLAVLFQCSVSSYFVHTRPLVASVLQSVIEWPSKEEVLNNMPVHFKKYSRVRGVVDCTEIFVERSRCLTCQLLSYSHYKSNYTVKFLVCISPAGTITFISRAFGGRASDKAITAQSGLLEKFEPFTDDIMVDRGFFIDELCSARAVGIVRPPFAGKASQFSHSDAISTADIARARVHVERVIQRIKIFKIFNCTIPWEMLPHIDQLFTVACGLTNLCAPILADDKFLSLH